MFWLIAAFLLMGATYPLWREAELSDIADVLKSCGSAANLSLHFLRGQAWFVWDRIQNARHPHKTGEPRKLLHRPQHNAAKLFHRAPAPAPPAASAPATAAPAPVAMINDLEAAVAAETFTERLSSMATSLTSKLYSRREEK